MSKSKEYMLMFHDKHNFDEDIEGGIMLSFRLSEKYQQQGTHYNLPQDLYDKVRNWASLVTWDSSIDDPKLAVYNINTHHRLAFEKLLESNHGSS